MQRICAIHHRQPQTELPFFVVKYNWRSGRAALRDTHPRVGHLQLHVAPAAARIERARPPRASRPTHSPPGSSAPAATVCIADRNAISAGSVLGHHSDCCVIGFSPVTPPPSPSRSTTRAALTLPVVREVQEGAHHTVQPLHLLLNHADSFLRLRLTPMIDSSKANRAAIQFSGFSSHAPHPRSAG